MNDVLKVIAERSSIRAYKEEILSVCHLCCSGA